MYYVLNSASYRKICPKKKIACGESNGHVSDDVMRSWKVRVMTPIRLGPNIAKTAGGAI